jgi:hypothetical protein
MAMLSGTGRALGVGVSKNGEQSQNGKARQSLLAVRQRLMENADPAASLITSHVPWFQNDVAGTHAAERWAVDAAKLR